MESSLVWIVIMMCCSCINPYNHIYWWCCHCYYCNKHIWKNNNVPPPSSPLSLYLYLSCFLSPPPPRYIDPTTIFVQDRVTLSSFIQTYTIKLVSLSITFLILLNDIRSHTIYSYLGSWRYHWSLKITNDTVVVRDGQSVWEQQTCLHLTLWHSSQG